MKAMIPLVMLTATLFSIAATAGTSIDEKAKALEIIDNFATRICIDVPLEGRTENNQFSGSIKLEVEGFFKKLAEAGIEAGGNHDSSEYAGVLQEDLASLAKKNMDCKLEVVKLLKEDFLPSTSSTGDKPAQEDPPKQNPSPQDTPPTSSWTPEQDTYLHDYYKGLSVSIISIQPNDKGQIGWTLLFRNEGQKRHGTGFDLGKSYVSDDQGHQYKVLGATIQSKELVYMQPGMSYRYTFTSEKPEVDTKELHLFLDNRQLAGKHPIIKASRQ